MNPFCFEKRKQENKSVQLLCLVRYYIHVRGGIVLYVMDGNTYDE